MTPLTPISVITAFVTVTAPNGSETGLWVPNQNITRKAAVPVNVKLEYSKNALLIKELQTTASSPLPP